MDNKKKLIIFCASMILAFVFWRFVVLLRGGEVSVLRAATGLNIHHYIYGVILILIAVLIFIFYKAEKYSIALAGFGIGSFFDSFISRLFAETSRKTEITNYNNYFGSTLFLFFILILISADSYLLFRKRKQNLLSKR